MKFAELLRISEYRAVYASMVLSEIGDQLARVALTLLVFERTRSAGLTALTYALTLLPDLVSGPLLSGLADRFPRRAVMIVTDLVRAGLVTMMVVPGMPSGCCAPWSYWSRCCRRPSRAREWG
ncbi:hypothetical protein DMP23_19960 [Amycolatopsis sp. A1MSW2902]